jgi:hypothetical protein
MIETRNPNRDDKNRHAKHAELPELVAAKQAKNWQVGKWEEACAWLVKSQESYRKNAEICTESEADDVTSMRHSAMPCISSVQLGWRSDVQKEISQRRLQGVKGKVQEVE